MAARFANVHQYAKNKYKNEIDKFAGKNQFSGRTLNFVFYSLYNREDMKEQVINVQKIVIQYHTKIQINQKRNY